MGLKTLFAGTVALMLAGSSLAYAQQRSEGDAASASSSAKQAQLAERVAFVDARIAEHKAILKLTPDQEKNWAAYETALRNLAKLRVERYQEQKSPNPVEHLRQRAEDLASASAALKQLADAEEPLLASFDDAQKHRFSTFGRGGHERHRD